MQKYLYISIIVILTLTNTLYANTQTDSLPKLTIAHDSDLWTPGPLIRFSNKGEVELSEGGRAVSGILATNTIICCVDNKFREFARDYKVYFDEKGLLLKGTLTGSIETIVQDQNIISAPYTEVSFYPNGKIREITPSENFKISTSDGIKITISSLHSITFGRDGKIRKATVAKKTVIILPNGRTKILPPGSIITIDPYYRITE